MTRPRVRSTVFALIFGFAVASYLQRQGIGIAAGRMMPELGLSQQQIGWILNGFLIVYAACQVPGALFGQRFGARLTLTLIGIVAVLGEPADGGRAPHRLRRTPVRDATHRPFAARRRPWRPVPRRGRDGPPLGTRARAGPRCSASS